MNNQNEWSGMAHSLSSSGVSSCNSEMDLDRYDSDESDGEGISFTTTESRCEQLYERGLEFKHHGDLEGAFSSFSKCLEGMQECEYFVKLPQTLQQLSRVSSSLNYLDRAKEYAEAEKLFHEAVAVPTARPREGAVKPKTKRRPFSGQPKASTSAACNPAEYGHLLKKKAEEFDRLARLCAKEGKFDVALDHCGKAANIRQCVLGKAASKDYFRLLSSFSKAIVPEVHTSLLLEGDLLKPGHVGTLGESTLCRASLPVTNGSAHQPQYTQNKTHLLHTGNTFSHEHDSESRTAHHPASITNERSFPELYTDKREVTPTMSGGGQECRSTSIHRDSRQDGLEWVDKLTLTNVSSSWKIQGKVQDVHPHHQEVNLCAGVTNNLTKLSELKNPMCVNLDLHKGPGREGMEQTRCLPLWVLLLPAFLALVTYVLYYH